MSPPKTVFLAINRAVNVRDILRTGILKVLRESGHRIVILTPAYRDPDFVREFACDNVVLEPMVPHRPGWLEKKLHIWRYTLFPELSETIRMLGTPLRRRSVLKRSLAAAVLAFKRILGARLTSRLLMWANVCLFPDRHHAELFERYRPDLVVLTEVFSLAPDVWILKRAVRANIPTLWLVRSWDNLVTKGVLPAPIDRLVVWSETMREEAVSLHGFDANQVYVAGAPHLDILTDVAQTPTRDEFFRRIGANPDKHLITYAMAPLTRADLAMEEVIIQRLWDLARSDRFASPCQLLVRLYPLRSSTLPPGLTGLPNLLIDVPGRPSTVFDDRDITTDDLNQLAATLRYSSVIVNVASTIVLEASACGTPSVCVAFDLEPRPYHQSHVRYFDFTHYKKLQACGGTHIARSMEDLVGAINAYLQDRSLDNEGRARIIDTMYSRLDGHAGERVGNYILEYLSEVGSRPHGHRLSRAGSRAA